MPSVTLYRSATPAGRMRTATISVDGSDVGSLKAKGRLTLDLDDGPHQLCARIGLTASPPLTLSLTDGSSTLIAIRANLVDRTASRPSSRLTLAVVDDFDDHGVSYREVYRHRPAIGYRRRSRREQMLWLLGFLLLVTSQIVEHTVSRLAGVLIGIPGLVIVVVIFIRLFIYHGRDAAN